MVSEDEVPDDEGGATPGRGSLVGGLHSVKALLKGDVARVARLLVQVGRRDTRLRGIRELARRHGVPVAEADRAELDRLTDGLEHQGVVAFLRDSTDRPPPKDLLAMLVERDPSLPPPLVLVLDEVQDPHNLGACLRSADAAGVDAVVIPTDNSCGMTPVVRKVASGAADTVPLYRVTNLRRTLGELQLAGLWIHGAAGEASQALWSADLAGPVAIVMGAEGDGLRRLTREACDTLFAIPMAGSVSSLNVSVATGIALFEARRQRGEVRPPGDI